MRISDWSSDVCSSDLLFAKHELANNPFNIGGIRFVDDCQRRFAPRAAAMLNSPDYIVGPKMLGDRCKAEHIARLETRSEERRGGKEGGHSCSSRVLPYH